MSQVPPAQTPVPSSTAAATKTAATWPRRASAPTSWHIFNFRFLHTNNSNTQRSPQHTQTQANTQRDSHTHTSSRTPTKLRSPKAYVGVVCRGSVRQQRGATATVAATSGWFLVRKFVVDSDGSGNGNGSIGFIGLCSCHYMWDKGGRG